MTARTGRAWDVRAWWATAQECGGQVSHEDGWTLIATKDLESIISPGVLEARIRRIEDIAEHFCNRRRYEARLPEEYIEEALSTAASAAIAKALGNE